MPNITRVNGFKPVRHLNGSPFNGQTTIYEVPVGETIPVFIGDFVQLSTQASTSNYATVKSVSTAVTANNVAVVPIVGVVVGIFNNKVDVDGKLTTGTVSLDAPIFRPASTKAFVAVADAPDLIFEAASSAVIAPGNINKNVDVASADQTTSGALLTGSSPMTVAVTAPTASATRPLAIFDFSTRVDNDPLAVNARLMVRINTHAYGNAVAGV
jgi:hypothetical protein